MSTYKVIQDIEAEDHILGPFSLRQFVYLLISLFFIYLNFLAITKNVFFLLVLFLPPAAFFGFLAFPFIKDQPTEVWALAKIRFLVKPRKKLWDQSSTKNLVTITVPKKIEVALTDGLNQSEVKNRLKALSETIDTRGWAIKNINEKNYSINQTNDRLITSSDLTINVPDYQPEPKDDILDFNSSPIASHMETLINQSTQDHRKKITDMMNSVASSPIKSSEEDNIDDIIKANLEAKRLVTSNLGDITSTRHSTNMPTAIEPSIIENKPMTSTTNPVILNLSTDDNLNLTSLSKEAQKSFDSSKDEVVISLR